ncbi:UbiH/UbiF/VisC/COQ6 family ubiquinone biosynthesis hydroxylase [Marinomonas algicola]|uniref:UbiH/UbiF/VisC/COQ6 family ubiquinone biosynthesis hydroxylase n=1 Tax=Marinomonas algicola TaxID=2773454 RepID=UPI00174B74FB|nr:UbiH/UbiF/VisC/COQ6 family ubiquinone biosynthesis hydroxylase [Marinomonas algicola]
MANQYDVAVIGAGMIGRLIASLLAQNKVSVALIDPSTGLSTLSSPPHYDTRVSAISAASQDLLETAGVWHRIPEERLLHYRTMNVWDGLGTSDIQFQAESLGVPSLGCMVENAVLSDALNQKNADLDKLHSFFGEQVVAFDAQQNHSDIILKSGKKIQATLIVAADGANSFVRREAGFSCREWDYGHHAIVATIEIDRSHENTAWQAFGDEGILAFLPLPSIEGKHIASIVWSVPPLESESLCQLDEPNFCRRLSYALSERFSVLSELSPRLSIPLTQRHATEYVKERIALVGDAAHTIHPLAGQGANIGFSDVRALVEILLKAHKRQDDIGRLTILRRYQRARMLDNLQMAAGMESFKRLYSTQNPLIVQMRNTGMNFINKNAEIKRLVVEKAFGHRKA